MEPQNIIAAFLEVIEKQPYIFDKQSREDLNIIKETLIKLENQPLQAAADAITDWCREHTTVSDAVRFLAREITIKSHKRVNRDTTLSNQFPEYKEKIDEQIKNTQPEINQSQPVENQ